MNDKEVSIAQGKKEFTKIIRNFSYDEDSVIITKRGNPAAVIMPFNAYRKLKRMSVYAELIELRKRLSQSGVSAKDAFEKSKRMLEKGK